MEDAIKQGGFARRTDTNMRVVCKQSGLTLTEMAVVAAIIGLLVALGIPAVRTVMHSFESESAVRSMIGTALSSARAIASKNRCYAGIRFQPDEDGRQHMIFIMHDPSILAHGFKAVPGVKPIALPESVGVMDMFVRMNRGTGAADCDNINDEPVVEAYLDDTDTGNLSFDGDNTYINDTRTFSIIFSPAGKIVAIDVRVRNREGVYRPDNSVTGRISYDDIFNSPENISNGIGRFIQDDYADLGFGAEMSRNRLLIYDRERLKDANAQMRYDYLRSLEYHYINPYTGTFVTTN